MILQITFRSGTPLDSLETPFRSADTIVDDDAFLVVTWRNASSELISYALVLMHEEKSILDLRIFNEKRLYTETKKY